MSDTRNVDRLYYLLKEYIYNHYSPSEYSFWSYWRILDEDFRHSPYSDYDDTDGGLPLFHKREAYNAIKNYTLDGGSVTAAKPSQTPKPQKPQKRAR